MQVAPGANKLEELLRAFSAAQCSDIRDKIYGLVGLASDAADLVIDYSKTPFDLFADVILLEERDPPEVSRRRRIKFAQFLQGVLAGKVETPTSKHKAFTYDAASGSSDNDTAPKFWDASFPGIAPLERNQLEQLLQHKYYNPFSNVTLISGFYSDGFEWEGHQDIAARRYDEIAKIIESAEFEELHRKETNELHDRRLKDPMETLFGKTRHVMQDFAH
ncbi:uncharacterized protein PAC_17088 [Phialocephala subalpina]|uniref:Uncharacterized protein n=1 Tax=Phialocephala subalpina TaxID=576137 RepID=A0A1L7XQ87_9HELO|nr:uncharacterized protein PAC_17088 [Phialocephala subalpina]